jgi:hypothetical protein
MWQNGDFISIFTTVPSSQSFLCFFVIVIVVFCMVVVVVVVLFWFGFFFFFFFLRSAPAYVPQNDFTLAMWAM